MVLSRELIDVALNAVVALSVFLPQYFVANASSYPEYECQFKLVNVSADQSVCHCTAGEKDALLFVVWVQFHICNCTDIVTEMIQMAVFVPWPGKQFRIYNASIIESSDAQFHGNFQSKSVNNSYFKDHYKEAHVFIYLQSSADGEVSLPSQGVFFKCKIFCPYK